MPSNMGTYNLGHICAILMVIENYVKTPVLMAAAETPVCALARPRGLAYRERSERR